MKTKTTMRLSFKSLLRPFLLGGIVCAIGSSSTVLAQNKCVDAKGRVTYSDIPCATASKQQTMQLAPQTPTPQQSSQTGNPELDNLLKSEKRLKWEVMSAEIDLRNTTNPSYIPGAQRKLFSVRQELDSVQMKMLAILDQPAYQRELARRKQLKQEARLEKAERDAAEAMERAAQAEQRAAAAEAGAAPQIDFPLPGLGVGSTATTTGTKQAPATYYRNGNFSHGSNGTTCFHNGSFTTCQ